MRSGLLRDNADGDVTMPRSVDLPEDGCWLPPPRGPLEEEEAERGGGEGGGRGEKRKKDQVEEEKKGKRPLIRAGTATSIPWTAL